MKLSPAEGCHPPAEPTALMSRGVEAWIRGNPQRYRGRGWLRPSHSMAMWTCSAKSGQWLKKDLFRCCGDRLKTTAGEREEA